MDYAGNDRVWWTAETEGVMGPFTQGDVFDAVRLGRLKENTLIRRGETGEWTVLISMFPAAFSAGLVQPPSAYAPPQAPTRSPDAARYLTGSVRIGSAVLLTIITLSIYWLVWIYRRLGWYQRISGNSSRLSITFFWVAIGLWIVSFVLLVIETFTGLAILLLTEFAVGLVSALFLALVIRNVANDQQAVVTAGVGFRLPMSPQLLVSIYVVASVIGYGSLLLPEIYGLVLLPLSLIGSTVFLIYFFRNHNAVIAVLAR